MNKKRKFIIAAASLSGVAIGAGIITSVVLLNKKKEKPIKENKNVINKNELQKLISNNAAFETEISSIEYQSIKTEYDALVQKVNDLVLNPNASNQEIKNLYNEVKNKINELKNKKIEIDNQNKTQEETKKDLIVNINNLLSESKNYINSDLNNEKYNSIKQELQTVINEIQNNSDHFQELSLNDLESKLNKIQTALNKAKEDKISLNSEEENKNDAIKNIEQKITEINEFIQTLTKLKYESIKQKLNSQLNKANQAKNNTSLSSAELRQVLSDITNNLNLEKQNKTNIDNTNITFNTSNAVVEDIQAGQQNTTINYKLISFELTSNLELDSVDELSNEILVNNQSFLITSKELKENSQNKTFVIKFKVYENKEYQITGAKLSEQNQFSIFNPLSVQVTGITNSNALTFQEKPNNNQIEPNIENITLPTQTLSQGLSNIFNEEYILELSNLEHYLYLINGERVEKYLPKKIMYQNQVYSISNENTENDFSTFTSSNNQNTAKDTQYTPKTYNSTKPTNKNVDKNVNVIYKLQTQNETTTSSQQEDPNKKTVVFKVKYIDYDVEPSTFLNTTKLQVVENLSNDFVKRHQNNDNHGVEKTIDGIRQNENRWTNWNDRWTDQSNLKNQFVYQVKNNEQVLINGLILNIRETDINNGLGGLVIPEEIRISVSQDGQNFTPVQHQDKIFHSDFGLSGGTNNVILQTYFNTRETSIKAVTINFEPTFAKYIKFQWKPRSRTGSNNQIEHYSWEISEIEFNDITDKDLDKLKNTYINKTTEKENILTKLENSLNYYKQLTDVSSKRYKFVIETAKNLSNSFTLNKEFIKSLNINEFKNEVTKYVNEIKKLSEYLKTVETENTTKNVDLENALKHSRELLFELNENLLEWKGYLDKSFYNQTKHMYDTLLSLNTSNNKTVSSILNTVDRFRIDFEMLKQKYEELKTQTSILTLNENSIKIENISTEKVEVSMDLNIWHLKNNENGSLKLNITNLPEGVSVSEVQFDNWYQTNTQTQPSHVSTSDYVSDSAPENNNFPKTISVKFVISGNPTELQNITFDKVLLGQNETINLPQQYNIKIQALQNAVTNFQRSYDLNNSLYNFSFELPEGMSLKINGKSKVDFKLESETINQYTLFKEANNKYTFSAPSINNSSQNNQNYLKELKLNINGTQSSDTNDKQTIKTQDNSGDLTFNPQNPLIHLNQVNLDIYDAYVETSTNSQNQNMHRIHLKIKNPELLIKGVNQKFYLVLGNNQNYGLTSTNFELNVNNSATEVQEFVGEWEVTSENNTEQLKPTKLRLGYLSNSHETFEKEFSITKYKTSDNSSQAG
ncbi:hypothetical protein [Mycoplasmopsis felis]|uniref:hypothetical protein n=1 Tax=Mycoplasmopsis felis TaxID=33923 RepID=UPI002AFFE178|nr:hypothetical protein [Mycoplasmopsis felis]WQQ09818.1 hypothetical protein RRG49_02450 [Mycoplasmopsis felis]